MCFTRGKKFSPNSKLLRSNRTKSDSNRVLIDVFDSIPAVRLLVATNPIRDLGPNSNLTSISDQKWSDLIEFEANLPNLDVFDINRLFSIN